MDLEHKKKRQETHTQLSDFFNEVLDLVQIFSEQGDLLFVNKAWQTTLGYAAHEIHSLNFYELIHPEYLSVTKSYLQRMQKDEKSSKFKTVLVAKDGGHVHVSGSISWKKKHDEGGAFRAIFHDISDQVRAERAQRLYNNMANLTIQSYDPDALYLDIHRELKKVINADNCYIALTDDKKEVYFPYYVKGKEYFFLNQEDVASEKDLVEYVIANNQSCILYEEDILELLVSTIIHPRKVVPQVWLGVPLMVNKRVIGMLAVQHFERRNALGDQDLELLNFASGQVALAIERKRNEEKLKEQTSRLNAIFESSTHLIWSIDRSLNFTSFNQNFMRVLQSHFSVKPVLHQVYNNEHPQISKEYLQQFKDKYKRAFEGRASQFELAFSLGKNHYLWKQIFVNPVYREDGSIHEVSGIAHDITHRKKSELALLESEEKFRNIFESFQDIYFRCNIEGTITLISPSVSEMTDYETSDVIGRNITNYYLYDSRTKNLIRKLVKNKSVRNFEATIIRSDGELLQCICNVRLIEHGDRSPEIEGVARDITELKKANQALQKAKDVAEKSLKIKDAFLANMSHEIRTPMNGIISMIDVLDQTKLDTQQEEYVQIIKSSSETLLSILNDILDLSKMEAGKMKLHRSSASINRIIHKLYRLFSQKAAEKNITFSYYLSDDMPTFLVVDEVRLLQILSNLTANALKFTPEGGNVTIEVADITAPQKRQHENTEHIIRIEVSDSGIGIAEEDQKTLFQNFSQADNSSTKRYEGTGLGLSIARQLVELMQGEINVKSVPEGGSKFWFTFRARVGQEEAPSSEANADNSISWKEKEFSPRILLVDDNETNRRVAYEILVHAGCTVETASSGAKAIALVQEKAFDLILMDIQMPDMDGIEATRAIKALPPPPPPIVAMTAYSMQGDKEKFMNAGLDDYLAKPIRAHILIQKISDLLKPSLGRRTVDTAEVSTAPGRARSTMDAGWPAGAASAGAASTGAHSKSEKEISQNESSPQVMNEAILKDLEKYGGDALIKDIFLDFEQEATDLMEDCFQAMQNNDIESILSKLHTLKGSAGTIGIDQVAQCTREIESKLKAGDQTTLAQDLLSLQENFLAFQKQLQHILNYNNNV